MWLKKLTLKNFQKHELLVLDFTSGVNILYGHSDAGKSCIRRAIGFLFFGDPRSDETIRKEDTKQTSVCGLLDNGTEVERVKSASINRYVVRVPDCKELVYDSIGADIPEEVQQVLQMRPVEIDKLNLNLNIAEQVCLPFLNGPDFPATARLKLFNKLTGNDLLDVVSVNFNKEILGINRELKNVKEIITTNEPQVEILDKSIGQRRDVVTAFVEKRKSLGEKIGKCNNLKEIRKILDRIKAEQNVILDQLANIKEVDLVKVEALKKQAQTLNTLAGLKTNLLITKDQLSLAKTQIGEIKAPELNGEHIRGLLKRLDTLKQADCTIAVDKEQLAHIGRELRFAVVPTLDTAAVRARAERITKLLLIQSKLVDTGAKIKQAFGEWNQIQKEGPTDADYTALLKEAKICPVCKQDTNKCETHT